MSDFVVKAICYNGLRVEFEGGSGNDGKWEYFQRQSGFDVSSRFRADEASSRKVLPSGQYFGRNVIAEFVGGKGARRGHWFGKMSAEKSKSPACVNMGDGRDNAVSARESNARDEHGATVPHGEMGGCPGVDGLVTRGKHYRRNKNRRERAKAVKQESREDDSGIEVKAGDAASDTNENVRIEEEPASSEVRNENPVPLWRRKAGAGGPSCPSLSGSVTTVDTRTAVEIEAANTLAARRVVENKVAIAKGEKLLRSFADDKKTKALETLEVVRMERRINVAKAESQAAYSKCDNSLKSAGSAASAGEFAMKKIIAQNAELKKLNKNLAEQVDVMLKYAPQSAWSELCAVPEVRKISIREVMGEPTNLWSTEETDAYYKILNAEAIGDFDTPWEDFF